MENYKRIIVSLILFSIMSYIFFQIFFPLFFPFAFNDQMSLIVSLLIAAAISLCIWLILGFYPIVIIYKIIRTGLIIGAISFVLGFFGPILFIPDANQGPLLGIFITGPFGFVIGLIGGGIYWAFKKEKKG